MPMVVGCIDGTLVEIDAPHQNEDQFVDRHQNHSINCMAVCGPRGEFYYVSARWPGSVHDSRVLRNSNLYTRMQSGWRPFPNAVILGDSGYPLTDWLLTPTGRNLENAAVQRYNRAHKSTRRIIENAFGILKEKFPCLNYMRLKPTLCCQIFKCCTILCNIARTREDEQQVLTERAIKDDADINDDEENIDNQRRITEMINFSA
ncbi:DDE superfamily endonuclease domain-containing protein [Phthorimaea operculella]|nr:DDE superfamily endonuclease domain-containing protein [Phthorimaea operculella]